jgi:hypothetical protein
MNAEFLVKDITFEVDPDHAGRIKPVVTRKGLYHDSFIGATGTLAVDEGITGCAIITAAWSDNNGVYFQAKVSNVMVTCQYNPETGIINGAIATTN